MAAQPNPPAELGVPMLTYVVSRFEGLDRRIDERFGHFSEKLEDLEDTLDERHEQTSENLGELKTAVQDLTAAAQRRRGAGTLAREGLAVTAAVFALALSVTHFL